MREPLSLVRLVTLTVATLEIFCAWALPVWASIQSGLVSAQVEGRQFSKLSATLFPQPRYRVVSSMGLDTSIHVTYCNIDSVVCGYVKHAMSKEMSLTDTALCTNRTRACRYGL